MAPFSFVGCAVAFESSLRLFRWGHEVKMFFCKYNDPIYVKLEKATL